MTLDAPGCPALDRIRCGDFFQLARAVAAAAEPHPTGASGMAKRDTSHRIPWTTQEVRELLAHSKARTPLTVIANKMKRTQAALRQRAGILGIGLGHRRPRR
jgi:hypothetical protein